MSINYKKLGGGIAILYFFAIFAIPRAIKNVYVHILMILLLVVIYFFHNKQKKE